MARIVLLILSLFAVSAWAQQTADIYRVQATVANQSESERTAATKAGLGDVITHLLGDSAALQNPLIQQALNEAPNYVTKFSYNSDTSIVLNYSPEAIQILLQQAQLTAVGANSTQMLKLYVVDVNNFTTFKQVQAYLKTIAVIRTVNLVDVDKQVMQFDVLLNGDVPLLKTVLDAGGKLQANVNDTLHPLSFRWQNQ